MLRLPAAIAKNIMIENNHTKGKTPRSRTGACWESRQRPTQNSRLQGKPSTRNGRKKKVADGIRLPEPAVKRTRFSCQICLCTNVQPCCEKAERYQSSGSPMAMKIPGRNKRA